MISEREIEVIERAVKVSAYSDEDACLILRALLIEKNKEIADLCAELEKRDLTIENLQSDLDFARDVIANLKEWKRMVPIKGYFSEENKNRRQAADALALEKIEKEYWERMKSSRDAAAGKSLGKHQLEMNQEKILSMLNLYVGGYGCGSIAHMMEMDEREVFRMLQTPLLRYVTGARGIGVFYYDKAKRIYPNVEAILGEIDALGMEPYAWGTLMMDKLGISRIYANRLIGKKEGYVPLPVAKGVCEYFGICGDLLFCKEPEKEKTAE